MAGSVAVVPHFMEKLLGMATGSLVRNVSVPVHLPGRGIAGNNSSKHSPQKAPGVPSHLRSSLTGGFEYATGHYAF